MPESQFEVRDLRKQNRYFVDNGLIERYGRKIGPVGVAVYNVLCKFANAKTQHCFPAHRTIAELLAVHPNTVKKYLRMLKEYAIISWESGKADGTSNTYFLTDPSKWGIGEGVVHEISTPSTSDVHLVAHQMSTKSPNRNQRRKCKGREAFEQRERVRKLREQAHLLAQQLGEPKGRRQPGVLVRSRDRA